MNVEEHLRQKLGDEEAKALLSSAVYLFNIGSNDYFAPFQENSRFFRSQHVQKEYIGRVLGNLTNVIQVIAYIILISLIFYKIWYTDGNKARKFFFRGALKKRIV